MIWFDFVASERRFSFVSVAFVWFFVVALALFPLFSVAVLFFYDSAMIVQSKKPQLAS